MTAKEYLMQYRIIGARLRAIDSMDREIREELPAWGVAEIRSPWPDGQPHGSGTGDPTGEQAARSADLMAEEYREKLRQQLLDLEVREMRARSELWRQRVEIEETIGKVGDMSLQEVLRGRYIEGKTFELLAVELHYSYRHTTRLHGEALIEIEKILQNS